MFGFEDEQQEKIELLEKKLAIAMEALNYIAPMEQPELYPCTRISKAATRSRDALEQIKALG